VTQDYRNWPRPLVLLKDRGDGRYDGEPITQREHGLQAAALAVQAGAPDSWVLAALLHDLGHLLSRSAQDATRRGIDLQHERSGANTLKHWFGPEVSEPVRLHVEAKRYLARDPEYKAALSAESQRSLKLQGGAMNAEEASQFEANPAAQAALALRKWDDEAKVEGLKVPSVASYVPLAQRLVIRD